MVLILQDLNQRYKSNERLCKKNIILRENEKNLSGEDVREGLTAIVSVKLLQPQFEGQTKQS